MKQRYEWDCFLCCITMAVDGDYDKLWLTTVDQKPPFNLGALNFVQRMVEKRGIYGDDIDKAFGQAGLQKDVDYWRVPIYSTCIDCAKSMLLGRRAILQAPSLNQEGGTHIVYWDGAQVHDPSPKQCYSWLQAMHLQYAWILK